MATIELTPESEELATTLRGDLVAMLHVASDSKIAGQPV